MEGSKLMGVGLKNAFALAVFTMIVIVMFKVAFTKHQVPGISPLVQSI